MRTKTGDDFWLMYDCWMSLDLDYAVRLAHAAAEYGLKWMEEALLPDDYWGYAELRRKMPNGMLSTTGEHEATRWGFRMLLEMVCADFCSPMWDGVAASRSLRKSPRSQMHMEFWSYVTDPVCIAITS